jgi:hypothetical protein
MPAPQTIPHPFHSNQEFPRRLMAATEYEHERR